MQLAGDSCIGDVQDAGYGHDRNWNKNEDQGGKFSLQK